MDKKKQTLKEKISNKLTYQQRMSFATWGAMIMIILFYFGPFLIYILFILGLLKTTLFVSIIMILLIVIIVLMALFVPTLEEQALANLKYLVANLMSDRKIKLNAIKEFNRSLYNLEYNIRFGFTKIVFSNFRDYMGYIISPIIFSNNDKILKIIKLRLSQITDFKDAFQLQNIMELLHKDIFNSSEFKALRVVYPSIKNIKNYDYIEILNAIHKDKPESWLKKLLWWLDERGLIKIIVGTIIVIFLSWLAQLLGIIPELTTIGNYIRA